MPPSNADVVRTNSAAFSRRDVETMMQFYAPDAVVNDRRPIGWGEFRGRDAIRSYYEGVFDNASEVNEEFDVVAEEGDVVIASCHLTVRLVGQEDAPVVFDYALRSTLADGQIVLMEIFEDAAAAAPSAS